MRRPVAHRNDIGSRVHSQTPPASLPDPARPRLVPGLPGSGGLSARRRARPRRRARATPRRPIPSPAPGTCPTQFSFLPAVGRGLGGVEDGRAFMVGSLVGAGCWPVRYARRRRGSAPHRTGTGVAVMSDVDVGSADRLALAVLVQYRMATTEQCTTSSVL